uniref:type IX secretion system sortase PorU n=1 Tax=Algoriphagus sp. TaxID=1872435 RepID=UPI0040476DA9
MKMQGRALLLLLGLVYQTTFSQTLTHTVGVTQSGVYKLSADQGRKLGFERLEEVALYGYPGMLPQKLDSAQLRLQEIPSWLASNQLYFYLEGPHQSSFTEQGELSYTHHLYTDTLRYGLGKSTTPQRIEEKIGQANPSITTTIWYQLLSLKEEKINLLNSGRSWYSLPIRQGQSLAINYGKSTDTTAPWLLYTLLMSQSTALSSFRITADDVLLEEVKFTPIPTNTYGIKGATAALQLPFSPKGNRLDQLRFSFQGTGSGHLDLAVLGIPFANSFLKEGIYTAKEENSISLETGLETWEVGDFYHPKRYLQGKSAIGSKWVVFKPSTTSELIDFRPVTPKNNRPQGSELLVISVPKFKAIAQQFQAFKVSQGISTQLIITSEIYDSHGYGNPDISAIRNFIAQEYHEGKQLKNVLILGKGTFDYKKKLGGRPNLIPIYTSRSSLDPLTTYSSDDYFGLVDWGLGNWEEDATGDATLRIGIGRIPAISYVEAKNWLEKTIAYEKQALVFPSSSLTFLADDGDNGVHMRDSEVHAALMKEAHPFFKHHKLYLDRYEQINVGGAQESPEAKKAVVERISQGTLLLNYVGHGNETTLMAEEVVQAQDLQNWPQQTQLPLWFTATCEFGRHDSPFLRSAAEELLLAPAKGAIGLLATGRPVFSSVNFNINQAFFEALAAGMERGKLDLGSLYRQTKNESLNGAYNRNFSLLGDPSLRLAIPEAKISIDKLVFLSSQAPADTVRPLVPLRLSGTIQDLQTKASLAGFNGKFNLEIWGHADMRTTKGDENPPFEFTEDTQRLFSGEGTVSEGKFFAQFIVPEQEKNALQQVQIRIQAWDSVKKIQASSWVSIPLKKEKLTDSTDKTGPSIVATRAGKPLLTNSSTASTQAEVQFIFEDPSGILVTSLFPERTLQIRVNNGTPRFIHESYVALEGSFEKGEARVVITGLQEGKNEIQVLASDNLGNLSTYSFTLEVRNSTSLQVLSHQIYPNPALDRVSIRFQHNRPQENLIATWSLYSSNGQVLISEKKRFIQAAEILQDWELIFLQSKTKYPAKGTYIYKLTLQNESSLELDLVSGKLVIQ